MEVFMRKIYPLFVIVWSATWLGGIAVANEGLRNPLPGAVITAKFGEKWYESHIHPGSVRTSISLVVKAEEADVLAASAGTVVFAGDDKHHDTIVEIEHRGIAGAAKTKYSFLRSVSVAKGQKVAAGEKIATVATHYGWVNHRFPPKLIFEVRAADGKPVDPCGFIECVYEKLRAVDNKTKK
jgi:murein DD-endopeptidase MepM/ murein hydrolase activator NlpD